MSDTQHLAGATGKTVHLEAITIADGLPYTLGAFNTVSATYTRDGSAPVALVLATAVVGTYTSSGFVHRAKGTYDVGAPTLALAAGADGVEFEADGIPGVMFKKCRVELSVTDPRAAVPTAAQNGAAANDAGIAAFKTFNRTTDGAATITNSAGAVTLTIVTDAAYKPIKSVA